MKYKNIIFFPPCYTFGDTFACIGLIYFLINYYERVYIYTKTHTFEFFDSYFKNDKKYKKNIFMFTGEKKFDNEKLQFSIHDLIETNLNGTHILNLITGCWNNEQDEPWFSTNFPIPINIVNKIIANKHYFSIKNPLYNVLEYDDKYKYCEEKLSLPLKKKEVNHIIYYKMCGLNNTVRLNLF